MRASRAQACSVLACALFVRRRVRRFTLVEVLTVLIVIGIFAGLIAPYAGGILRRTTEPSMQLREANRLVTVMERIQHDYENNPALRGDLAAFRTKILGVPVEYGQYIVVACNFITFDANGNEIAGTATDLLKVALRNDAAFMTMLFPHWPDE